MACFPRRRVWAPVLLAVAALPLPAQEPLVSTMRNVNAVMEARGFRIIPAPDLSGDTPPGDEAPVFAVEIVRPRGEKITVNRLFTSCSCVQLETDKHTFEEGERAVLRLRNITPTPAAGQIYALYVQVTGPIRTTLRYDAFIQSARFLQTLTAAPPVFTAATAPTGPVSPPAEPENAAAAEEKREGGERSTLDKYGAAPEPDGAPRGETEAFKAAEALKEQKEREARAAGEAILRTEELLKTRREESAGAEEALERRREDRKAAAAELEKAEAALDEAIEADALRRRELLATEEELESHKREKETREREAQKAAVAIEALREVGE